MQANRTVSMRTLIHTTFADAPVAAVFPLLCPVREHDWLAHWKCELLHSDSGVNGRYCVFETDGAPAGKETWVTVDHVPNERVLFLRFNRDWIIHYDIRLVENEGRTAIVWKQVLQGVTEAGNVHVAAMTQSLFEQKMDLVGDALNYYVKHGQCLGHSDGGHPGAAV